MNPEQRLKQLKELRDTKRWESIVDSILELAEIIKKETPKEELLAKLTALETSMKEKDDTPILNSITNLSEELKKKEFFTEETFNEVVSEVLSLIEKPKDGEKGADGKDGRDGKDGVDGINGTNGKDGLDGLNGKDGSPDTPDEVIEKVIKSKKLIPQKKIEGLDDLDRMVKHQLYTGISETRALELINSNSPSGGGTWGSITGTLSDQTDLQSALNLKAPLTSPTFATSITGSYLTASEILGTDASKNIVSLPVATYPSLTELSRVKGVTSAIQTQIDAKPSGSGTGNWLTYWVTPSILGALNTGTYPDLTELSYLKGVSSSIQTQLNTKLSSAVTSLTSANTGYLTLNASTGAVTITPINLVKTLFNALESIDVADTDTETSVIATGSYIGTQVIQHNTSHDGSSFFITASGVLQGSSDNLEIFLYFNSTVICGTLQNFPFTGDTEKRPWSLNIEVTRRSATTVIARGMFHWDNKEHSAYPIGLSMSDVDPINIDDMDGNDITVDLTMKWTGSSSQIRTDIFSIRRSDPNS